MIADRVKREPGWVCSLIEARLRVVGLHGEVWLQSPASAADDEGEAKWFFINWSGCCKPPTACGYTYVNPTLWINPGDPAADPDCSAWSNDQSQLCYGCNSCRAGTLGNLRMEWRKANVALIVATVALIFVYVIGCSAFQNAQTEDLFRRYKQGWV